MKLQKKKLLHLYCSNICIGSILKVNKKNYPQVYLEQCKCKIKKTNLADFIDAELDLKLIMNDYNVFTCLLGDVF